MIAQHNAESLSNVKFGYQEIPRAVMREVVQDTPIESDDDAVEQIVSAKDDFEAFAMGIIEDIFK